MKVLNQVVMGSQGTLTPRGSISLSEILSEADDLENVRDSHSVPTSPRSPLDALPEYLAHQRRSPSHQPDTPNMLKIAARTVSI